MGALYGFTGSPDAKLLTGMGDVLVHRGRYSPVHDQSSQGSLAYRACFEDDVRTRLGAGLHADGEQAIALAGQLTGGDTPATDLPSLLACYRKEGPLFVSKLRGAFILAVRDGDTIHLARDGAGVRTAYYGRHAGRFLFAIEPKGVLAAPGFPRRLRPAAVAQYLTFSFVPGSGTMLEDLYELPAGHVVSCDGRSDPVLTRYFTFEDIEPDGRLSESDWIARFRDTFAQAVAERLPAGEPVGVFLSGGIDSSVVAAEVARRHAPPVKTYAIHFGKQYLNELDFARAVADHCGTEHEEVFVRPRAFLPRLRRMIWHLDDPVGDPVTVANYELSARVSQDVRWVFNGEGGDPCFGGPKNLSMLLHHWYGGIPRDESFRARMYLASYRRGYEELSRLLSPELKKQIDPARDLEALLQPFFAADRPKHFLNKLMVINIRLKGAHLILPKVERMTGAWGLVPLAPLFDERLVRMSFALPVKLKMAGGVEKIILKRAFAGDLPPEIIARPKSGMRVPVHFWFQGELRRYARKILSPRAVRRAGIFDPDRVGQLLRYDTEEGPGRYGLRLWMLLTFEIWRRIVIEGEAV